MANTKIYVVTSGCYSDYHICFCTLNYELAKKYVDARNPYLNSWDEFQIHEYEDNIAKIILNFRNIVQVMVNLIVAACQNVMVAHVIKIFI